MSRTITLTKIKADRTEEAQGIQYSWARLTNILAGLRDAVIYGMTEHMWQANKFAWCEALTQAEIRIVDFDDPELMGKWNRVKGKHVIELAFKVFDGEEVDLIDTLVHELAHELGEDGSSEHYTAQIELLALYAFYLRN